jgi:hypothetical protein
MYRVLAVASVAASLGLAIAVAPSAHARGGQFAPRFSPKPLAQPVIANPGIGVLHRPQSLQRVGRFGGHHRNFNNFGNLGLGSGFVFFDNLNGAAASTNTNTIINNVTAGFGSSGVQEATGIREAPPMRPAIYVIEPGEGARQRTQRQGGPRVVELGAAGWADLDETATQDAYGARIIRVPAR